MSGQIIDSFETFRFLRYVDLSDNRFVGTLPATIFDIPMVEILYFSGNFFSGTLPVNYGNASNLRDLYVDNNKLAGTVPNIMAGQLGSLTEFVLDRNVISGTMPASVCALTGTNSTSTNSTLVALVADCGGSSPRIICVCCSACV